MCLHDVLGFLLIMPSVPQINYLSNHLSEVVFLVKNIVKHCKAHLISVGISFHKNNIIEMWKHWIAKKSENCPPLVSGDGEMIETVIRQQPRHHWYQWWWKITRENQIYKSNHKYNWTNNRLFLSITEGQLGFNIISFFLGFVIFLALCNISSL